MRAKRSSGGGAASRSCDRAAEQLLGPAMAARSSALPPAATAAMASGCTKAADAVEGVEGGHQLVEPVAAAPAPLRPSGQAHAVARAGG